MHYSTLKYNRHKTRRWMNGWMNGRRMDGQMVKTENDTITEPTDKIYKKTHDKCLEKKE